MSDARQIRGRGKAAIVMVVLVSVWGYAWVLSKMALATAGRWISRLFASHWRRQRCSRLCSGRGRPIKPTHFKEALFVGVVQTALFLMLNNWALSQGEPGKTSVLVFTMPFWVLVFAWPCWASASRAGAGWRCARRCGLGLDPGALGTARVAAGKGAGGAGRRMLGTGCGGVQALAQPHRVDVFNFTFWQMVLGLVVMVADCAQPRTRGRSSGHRSSSASLVAGHRRHGGRMDGLVLRAQAACPRRHEHDLARHSGHRDSRLGAAARRAPDAAELTGMVLVGAALAIVSWDMIRKHREVEPPMGQE